MKKAAEFLLYSNLYTFIVVYALMALTDLLLDQTLYFDAMRGAILGGTLFLYPAHRLYAVYRHPESALKRIRRASTMKTEMVIIALAGLIVSLYFFFRLNIDEQIYLAPVVAVGVLYSFPVLKFAKIPPLRELPLIKPLIIAAVVSYATVFLIGLSWSEPITLIYLTAVRFFLITALTLPFDIRDIQTDAFENLRTWPIVLGEAKTRSAALFSNVIYTVGNFTAFYFLDYFPLFVFLALWLGEILASAAIKKLHRHATDVQFAVYAEGALVLQPVLVVIAIVLTR